MRTSNPHAYSHGFPTEHLNIKTGKGGGQTKRGAEGKGVLEICATSTRLIVSEVK